MDSTTIAGSVQEELYKMVSDGRETEMILKFLVSSGIEENEASEMIRAARSEYLKKRRARGFTLGIIGSILLVVGFVLTVIFFHSDISIHYVMYGLTSLGAILLMAGMVDVIGW